MSPSLRRLTQIEPPPISPVAKGSLAEWSQIEAEVGTQLPEDFKDYISLYGAGQWAEFFGVRNPFYQWKRREVQQTWSQWMKMRFEGQDESRRMYPQDFAPFSLFPAPVDGVIPFGYHDNGGTLCWHPVGEPDSWRIICLDGKFSESYDVFDLPLTGFLASLLSGEIFPKTFAPDLFPIQRPAFRPYTNE